MTVPDTSPDQPDSQRVEVLGRNLLVSSLLRAGVEVARPERDRGIDLLAYIDKDIESGRFSAVPIQMKASQGQTFSITKKYAAFPSLVMAYVWNVNDPDRTVIYAMNYADAHAIAQEAGWLKTTSWETGGHYVSNRPSAKLLEQLEAHRATPEHWTHLVHGNDDNAGRTWQPTIPGIRTCVGDFEVGESFDVDGEEHVVISTFIDGALAVPLRRRS